MFQTETVGLFLVLKIEVAGRGRRAGGTGFLNDYAPYYSKFLVKFEKKFPEIYKFKASYSAAQDVVKKWDLCNNAVYTRPKLNVHKTFI